MIRGLNNHFMAVINKKLQIVNKEGLHARPAAEFVQIANKYDAEIKIKKDDLEVNGKSIMGVLMLEAGYGTFIEIIAEGDDAEEAIVELERLVKTNVK